MLFVLIHSVRFIRQTRRQGTTQIQTRSNRRFMFFETLTCQCLALENPSAILCYCSRLVSQFVFSCNNTNDNIKCNGRKSCICKKMHAIEMIRSNDTVNAGCTISLLLVKSTEPPRGLDTRSSAKLCGGGDPTDRGGKWHTGVQRHHPHRSANP